MRKIFLLSPASSSGKRAELLFNSRASFQLAHMLQAGEAVPISQVFSFLSGLYFRGKIEYARRYASVLDDDVKEIHVITPDRGLLTAETPITLADLKKFGRVPVDVREEKYSRPFERAITAMSAHLDSSDRVILLGSVATGKYTDILCPILGDKLLFPTSFIGIGDMSRGAILLRSAASGDELAYAPVDGAIHSTAKGRPRKKQP